MKTERPVFSEADVLEFAEGRVAHLFGRRYAAIDRMTRRIRVPAPPMLVISRVTAISGTFGSFAGARIETEFDIPAPFWNSVDGRASAMVLDPQGIQFLVGWLGLDLATEANCSYRWVSGQLTYEAELPRAGQRVITDVRLLRFVRRGPGVFAKFEFDAVVDGTRVLSGRRCVIGMLPQSWLARDSNGSSFTADPVATEVEAPLPLSPRPLESVDLAKLARGGIAEVLSWDHAVGGNGLRLPPRIAHFLDRVLRISNGGGLRGLGYSEGEMRLDPLHWAVRAHFKDDPVFPGPCMLEGATQLLKVHALVIGLQAAVRDARFEPVINRAITVSFRSQVVPSGQTLSYRAHVVEVGWGPEPYLVADVECVCDGQSIGWIQGLGIRMANAQPLGGW